jgi:hypothetical protein
LQLTFALLKETLLLLPAFAVLRRTLLLHSLLPPLPVRVIALSRSVPVSGLSLLVLSLLFLEPPTLLIRLALPLIVSAPSALLLCLLLLPLALLFFTL